MDFRQILIHLVIAVGAGVVLVVIEHGAVISVRRSLQQFGEQGEDDQALWQALWAGHDARLIRRKLSKRAGETAAEVRLAQEMRNAAPRWRTELAGAYLVWWLCVAFWILWFIFQWPVADGLLESIGVITACGWLFRVILLAVLRGPGQESSERLGTLRFYRWWAKGWLPGLVALLPGLVYWVAIRVTQGR